MTGSNWTSCDLRSVEVGVVGAAQCGAAMSQPVTQDMMCAGGVANQGACVVSASEVSRHSIQLIFLHRTYVFPLCSLMREVHSPTSRTVKPSSLETTAGVKDVQW